MSDNNKSDYKIPVSLSRLDWDAVLLAIQRHVEQDHFSGGRVCYDVGRARLRHITRVITDRLNREVKA